ncbi:MAG TPA: phosphatase [Candidatus Latescibacteria bacterium]|jgi:protein tyrosine phosphatase (PTP) superfamily phosphohydrolase (DUF442 family)|nr:phosphatase [Candidatus Latescibacterota bacterium]
MRFMMVVICLAIPAMVRAQMESATDSTLESVRAFVQISERVGTSGQIGTRHVKTMKESGYELVINLAPARERMNKEESFAVVSAGIAYVQIPVDFQNPALRDLEFFFQVMNANKDRKVYVHCFANMRVSSFIYLYRVIHEGVAPEEADKALKQVWEPNEDWTRFIEKVMKEYGK